LHSGVSQLAAAILLDGKRLQSYAREIVRLAQPAGNLFRQFNSNVRQRGDIVRGTGGVRKARVADTQSGRGKRGSYRYLYLYPEHRGRIYLLYLYGKGEQSELSPEQKKTVASLAQMIKEESK
jgi:hypothetical protein